MHTAVLLSPVTHHLLFFCMLPCRHAASPTHPIVMTKGLQSTQVLNLLLLDTQDTLCALSELLSEWSVQLTTEKSAKVQAHMCAHTHPAPANRTVRCERSKALARLGPPITCHNWMVKSIEEEKNTLIK